MIQYNVLDSANIKLIGEKAKVKKDGIYVFRGILFRVQDHRVSHYAVNGQVLESFGNFNAIVGAYDRRDQAIAILKKVEKNY